MIFQPMRLEASGAIHTLFDQDLTFVSNILRGIAQAYIDDDVKAKVVEITIDLQDSLAPREAFVIGRYDYILKHPNTKRIQANRPHIYHDVTRANVWCRTQDNVLEPSDDYFIDPVFIVFRNSLPSFETLDRLFDPIIRSLSPGHIPDNFPTL